MGQNTVKQALESITSNTKSPTGGIFNQKLFKHNQKTIFDLKLSETAKPVGGGLQKCKN
jgi:hypothetical protein